METMAMEGIETTSPLTRKNLLRMLAGFVLGAAFAYGCVKLAELLHVSLKHIGWADGLCLWLGVTYFGIGATMLAISLNRRELARNLELGEATVPASEEEVRAARLQASTLVLAGVLLLVPVLTSGSLAKTPAGAAGVFCGILALFALQTAANVAVWRAADEFQRGVILAAGALTFALTQGALFLWAAAERLRLVSTASAWNLVMAMMTVYLAVGFSLQARTWRGR